MNVVYIMVFCLAFILPSLLVNFKRPNQKIKLIKTLSILLFLTYLVRLFSRAPIDQTFNLLLIDITTPINSPNTWLFSPPLSILILFQRWFGVVIVAWIITALLYPNKYLKTLIGYIGVLIGISYVIFIDNHLIAMQGDTSFTYQTLGFMVEAAIIMCIAILFLIDNYKIKFSKRVVKNYLLIIFGSMLGLMPQTILINLFGNYGSIPKDFNIEHIFLILFPMMTLIVIYKVMKNKEQSSKEAIILFMAIAGVFQYFYMRREDLAALPFHLCNTAVILIFFAVVFKIKSFFYFAYFANVVGTIGGILLPNYETDMFSLTVIHFLYNHWYALIVPILAVALGVFKKPKLKDMYSALIVFTGYFVLIIFLNAWFNNYTLVDYFFAYDDFLTEMFNARDLQYDYIISFEFNGLTFQFFWLFQLIYYFSFIGLMFLSWYIYDAAFNEIDKYRNLREKQKQMKMDKNLLIKQLLGRPLNARMYEEKKNMIEIKNFSKKYGRSKNYAVKDLTLTIEQGEIFGFLGHNGAGKSTTIKSMVGIQSITEGEILIDGYSIKAQPIEAKLRIGYVSDNHAVYEKLTGREYINYVADLYKIDQVTRDLRFNKLLTRLNLAHAIDQEVKSYSHGMKQKLVVIASLIHEPKVWILDEPLTGLDPTSSYEIKEAMKLHAKNGNIVFFSSHVIEVVEKICTKIAVINQGKLMGVYDVKDLRDRGISLETLYMQGREKDDQSD